MCGFFGSHLVILSITPGSALRSYSWRGSRTIWDARHRTWVGPMQGKKTLPTGCAGKGFFYFGFWTTPNSVQVLFLALCSEIFPDGELYKILGVNHVQDKCPTHCALALAPGSVFLFNLNGAIYSVK